MLELHFGLAKEKMHSEVVKTTSTYRRVFLNNQLEFVCIWYIFRNFDTLQNEIRGQCHLDISKAHENLI